MIIQYRNPRRPDEGAVRFIPNRSEVEAEKERLERLGFRHHRYYAVLLLKASGLGAFAYIIPGISGIRAQMEPKVTRGLIAGARSQSAKGLRASIGAMFQAW